VRGRRPGTANHTRMFFLRRPSDDTVRELLEAQSLLPYTYAEIGASLRRAPRGYPLNHHRDPIGRGEGDYRRAVAALRRWAMYEIPWTVLCWPDRPLEPGVTVGVLVWHFGFWSLNPCRIVYTLEEESEVERFGFAFGTLPGHSEAGEERFTVAWRRADDTVWYEIYTFARAHHPLVRIGSPLLPRVQFRFGRESVAAMRRAVRAAR
jgi:uncharacterized protein (UPF0548 family)